MNRSFDIAIYGATGFVGQQTAQYLREHYPALRIALAGRNKNKLNQVAQQLGLDINKAVIEARSDDVEALNKLTQSTRVVLSTAGPFALYGSDLVAACVAQKTHYVDITGETPWVAQMIALHHEQARADGTTIVPCCGFDSVPSDLGAWLAAQTVKELTGEVCTLVKATFSMKGGLNGGTLASLANIMGVAESSKAARDLFLLNPPLTKPSSMNGHRDVLLPSFDKDFNAWIGPFIMATINTRVVRRSAALSRAAVNQEHNSYGNNFQYQETMRFGKGAKAAAMASALAWGLGAGALGMQFSPIRRAALKLGPAPGEGPSEESMDNGGFKCEYFAQSLSGKIVRGKFATKGDPGNRATTKFVCESAVALIEDFDKLAHNKGAAQSRNGGGVLTPSFALGQVLVDRLRNRNTLIEFSASQLL